MEGVACQPRPPHQPPRLVYKPFISGDFTRGPYRGEGGGLQSRTSEFFLREKLCRPTGNAAKLCRPIGEIIREEAVPAKDSKKRSCADQWERFIVKKLCRPIGNNSY